MCRILLVEDAVPEPEALRVLIEQHPCAGAIQLESCAFSQVSEHVSKRLYFSGFAKAEAGLARRANIRFARTRHEDGVEFAVTRITPLFGLFGADRPSTLGSQALLRMYGLN